MISTIKGCWSSCYRIIRGFFRGTVPFMLVLSALSRMSTAMPCQQSADRRAGDAQAELSPAMNQRDTTTALRLIRGGLDVNARDGSCRTSLIWAAQWGRLEVVQALIEAGADVDVRDPVGASPLTAASGFEHFDIVQALIKAGADRSQMPDVNAKDLWGGTPLMRAVGRKDTNSAVALIQLGADPNATDRSGTPVIFTVAWAGQLDVLKMLIEAGASINVKNEKGWTPLMIAAQMHHGDIVEALVKAGADATVEGPNGWNALMFASYNGDLQAARALIGVTNVNHRANGISALMLARWACDLEIINALVKTGAVTDKQEFTRPPRFEDFGVIHVFKDAPARIDLSSNPTAREYRTRLREGAKKGPNFAGHYTVIDWGCGSNCQSIAIVDALTGKVYVATGTERGADFKLNSSLMIADLAHSKPVDIQTIR
jgi:ankyrin repeat protein